MAGGLIAPVVDGKIKDTESQTSLKNAKEKEKKSTSSKDTFLKLLVAEVQNQDPMQPTSNTEWVSQYATFSELETMQSMSASLDLSRASSLVGKTVMIQTKEESGKVTEVQGRVDYVTYEAGKAYVTVDGSQYSIDDVRSVIDDEYITAYEKVYAWTVKLNKLPSYEDLTAENAEDVESLYVEYDKMSNYEKTFVANENAKKIEEYYDRIQTIKKELEESKKAEELKRLEEEARRAEEERKAAEAKKAEEEKKAEEANKAEEEKKPEEISKPEATEKPEADKETRPEESGAVTPEAPKEDKEEPKDTGAEGAKTEEASSTESVS